MRSDNVLPLSTLTLPDTCRHQHNPVSRTLECLGPHKLMGESAAHACSILIVQCLRERPMHASLIFTLTCMRTISRLRLHSTLITALTQLCWSGANPPVLLGPASGRLLAAEALCRLTLSTNGFRSCQSTVLED